MTRTDELVVSKGVTALLEETEPDEVEETERVNPWAMPLTIVCARDADDDEDFDEEEEDLDYFYDDDDDEDFDDEFDDDLEEEVEEEEDEEG